MTFVHNYQDIARAAILGLNPSLENEFVSLISFLARFPAAASGLRGKHPPEIGSADYITVQSQAFVMARTPRAPKAPDTVPDEMVSVILNTYFGIPAAELPRVQREHSLSMGAENLVGDLLERYLASVLEPLGWIWCSGAIVKAVDFIKPPSENQPSWRLLQVKNRDNSENSSSSAIRLGTDIEKWHRTFSKRHGSNWEAFPDQSLKSQLSEIDFKSFVRNYLSELSANNERSSIN